MEIYDKMGLAAGIACLYAGKSEDVPARAGACSLLASVVDDEGGVEDKSNGLVCGDVGIVMAVSDMLEQWVKEGGEEDIVAAVDLIRDIAKNDKTQAVISKNFGNVQVMEGGVHPVGSLVRVMTRSGCSSSLRESVVCALTNLALIPSIRPTFILGVPSPPSPSRTPGLTSAVRALLATARAHKTETAAARTVALGTLMNATVGKEGDMVKEEIVSFGGIPILVALATSDKVKVAPVVVKQRAAGLLGRVVTSKKGMEAMREDEGGGAKALGRELVKTVMEGWEFEKAKEVGGDEEEEEVRVSGQAEA